MNQFINDNQHKIDTACQLCFYTIDKYHQAVNAFNDEKRRIAATPYIQEEKERMVNRAADSLSQTAQSYYDEIKNSLKAIRDAALDMEGTMDVGLDFQNALSVVNALGKNLPVESILNLIEQFKGQRQALVLLKAAMESADVPSAAHYFDNLIFDAASALDNLDDLAYRIMAQPGSDLWAAVRFGSELEKFALNLGVELSKRFRDIVDTREASNQQLRAVMGLGASD